MTTIAELGEKRLISEFIRPFFNASMNPGGVGDDCAVLEFNSNESLLASTDRTPANLISFELGILDYKGLGSYLASLNLSDIAASGGRPAGLLLNFGLPLDFDVDDLKQICRGVSELASQFDCPVLGGDLSESIEISLSATSLGKVTSGTELTRRGARDGDLVFTSRPIGLTPAAFEFFLTTPKSSLSDSEIKELKGQFSLEPLVELGQALADSGICSSCMDNTDGLGQTLLELSENSECSIVLEEGKLSIPTVVQKVAEASTILPLELALGPGADFSLVGTLTKESAIPTGILDRLSIIGEVRKGRGVWLSDGTETREVNISGWSYFLNTSSQ